MRTLLFILFVCANLLPCYSQHELPSKAVPKFVEKQSISFRENAGQVHDQLGQSRADVLFYGKVGNLNYHLRNDGISYQLEQLQKPICRKGDSKNAATGVGEDDSSYRSTIYRVDINWKNLNTKYQLDTGRKSGHLENYYLANCPEGITAVRSFAEVSYRDIYPGIDLRWYEKYNKLEYDYIVAPGADPGQIKWTIDGASKLFVDKDGSLVIETPLGQIKESAPIAFQGNDTVDVGWLVTDELIGFEVGDYEPDLQLVIDPVVRLWGTYHGGTETERIYGLATDDSSNVILTGVTSSTSLLATIGSHQDTMAGSGDAFVSKFDQNGNKIWSTYYGGSNGEEALDVVLNASNDVFFGGWTRSNTGMATAGTHQPNYSQSKDGFLVKLHPNGVRAWGTYFGGPGDDWPKDLSIDTLSNIYMSGYTSSSDSISTTGSHQEIEGGLNDAFLAKFDSAGTRLWGTYYGGTESDFGEGCHVDVAQNVYLTGATKSFNFGSIATPGSHQPGISLQLDGFLAKFDPSGVRLWGTYYGGFFDDRVYKCSSDNDQNVYIIGSAHSSNGIATPGSHRDSSYPGADAYIAKFDSAGVRVWGTYFGGPGAITNMRDIVVDQYDNVFVVGNSDATTEVATPGSYQTTFLGNEDGFVTKFNAQGVQQWGTYYGGTGLDIIYACAVGDSLNLYVGGGTASSNGIATAGAYRDTVTGPGDAFLVRLYDCFTDSSTAAVTACDSMVSPSGNSVWVSSGTYVDTASNVFGCDSIATIILTIVPSSYDTIYPVVCSSYTSPSGIYTWDTTGIYNDTLTNSIGCDSIIQINLTVQQTFSAISVSACSSYSSPSGNNTWTSSGIYLDTLLGANSNSCDSIITITLTVNVPSYSSVFENACQTYTVPSGSFTVSTSGIYQDTLVGANSVNCDSILTITVAIDSTSLSSISVISCGAYNSPSGNYVWDTTGSYADTLFGVTVGGCDSIISINLQIATASYSSVAITACDSLLSPSGNYNWSVSGMYSDTIINGSSVGCDSIISMDLTILNSSTSQISDSACQSYTSPSGNHVWTSSGTYADTLQNSIGCDSIIEIQLDVTGIDTTIGTMGATLTSNSDSSNYQWLDCDSNFSIVTGATQKVFVSNYNGNFAVELTKGSCIDTSACVSVFGVGISDNRSQNQIAVFPNPTRGTVHLRFFRADKPINIKLFNAMGKLLDSREVKSRVGDEIELELPEASGVYYLKITSQDGEQHVPVIKL